VIASTPVDDHERRRVALAQRRERVEQRAATDAAYQVADEQDARAPGLLVRRRLRLSHTLPMVGGR
jgi:hypothetical protein